MFSATVLIDPDLVFDLADKDGKCGAKRLTSVRWQMGHGTVRSNSLSHFTYVLSINYLCQLCNCDSAFLHYLLKMFSITLKDI